MEEDQLMSNTPTPPPRPPTVTEEEISQQNELYGLLVKSADKQAVINEMLRERKQILGEFGDQLRSDIQLQNQQLLVLQTETEVREEFLKTGDRLKETNEELKSQRQDLVDLQKELQELSKTDLGIFTERGMELRKEIDAKKDSIDSSKEQIKQLENQNRLVKSLANINVTIRGQKRKALDVLKQEGLEEADRISALEQARGINEELLSFQQKQARVAGNVAKKFGLSAQFSETTLGSIVESVTQGAQLSKAMGIKGVAGALVKSYAQSLDFANILGSVLDRAKELAFEIDATGKGIQAATGFTQNFNSQVMNVARNTAGAGASVAQAGKAIQALSTGFSAFNPANEATNIQLATTIVQLEKIGVTGAQSTKLLDFLTRTMNMSASSANDFTVELAQMGQQMGVSSSKMITDFQAVAGTIVVYGNRSMDVFKDLAAQAKATGLEINTLVKVAGQFDEFDKATQAVANLNAVLGTQLSAVQMISTDEGDRIHMLRQQVQMSVGNLNIQDKFTQKFIAQAIGVQDVNEAMRLLNMSQDEYLKYQNDMDSANKTQETLAQLTKDIVPLMDQFKIIIQEVALTLGPFINGILEITKHVLNFAKGVVTLGGLLEPGTSGLILGVVLLGRAIFTLAGGFSFLSVASGGILPILGLVAVALAGISGVMGSSINPLFVNAPEHMGLGFDRLGEGADRAGKKIKASMAPLRNAKNDLSAGFGGLAQLENLNVDKLTKDLTNVKSVLLDLANSKIDGFLAIRTDGTATSMVLGSESVMKNISEGKIQVDVNIPQIASPKVDVKVFIDGSELTAAVKKSIVVGA